MGMDENLQVAVIGAGPAGLFAAETLANNGYEVALFNRDIKPGGLAEYGIFPDKYKMKNGLRNQFKQILNSERIAYYGNIHVGVENCLGVPTLFEWGFDAVLITCGAQGVKSLHLPGEELLGVVNAKDLVFNYNRLPPYSLARYQFGRKVVIVGAGNVMADIAHYLIEYTKTEEITVVIRRGPGEVKFDKKEMVYIISYVGQEEFDQELSRVSGEMVKIGQDPQAAKEAILAALPKAYPKEREALIKFHFLSSPTRIIADKTGKIVAGIELEENNLVLVDGEVAARGTGKMNVMETDNVIFAIGDRVLDELGLPMNRNGFFVTKKPLYPVDGNSFEIEDSAEGKTIPGVFVAGWSRNPSTGLVGIARKDGVNGALAVGQYLAQKPAHAGIGRDKLMQNLKSLGCVPVTKEELPVLEAEEKLQAEKADLDEYKFETNQEMLHVLGLD